ncbi:MAG: hypothetical protein C0433_06085 [Cyclobacterium sp.]|nr:hypothetical protein [Cyclobacterium sp.]
MITLFICLCQKHDRRSIPQLIFLSKNQILVGKTLISVPFEPDLVDQYSIINFQTRLNVQ